MTDENTEDSDVSNMFFRAGYLHGLAHRMEGEDKEITLRGARSLLCAAKLLRLVRNVPTNEHCGACAAVREIVSK